MGIDFGSIIKDVGSAVEGVVEEGAGALSKIPDPIAMGIGAVGNALGLDPKITGMLEAGVGVMTGDVMCAVHGANDIMNSKDPQSGAPAGSTGAAPGADSGYADPAAKADGSDGYVPPDMDYKTAAFVMQQNFDLLDTAGGVGGKDGLIGKSDLQAALKNPNVPPEVKAACQFMLQNPSYLNQLDTAGGQGNVDGLIGHSDLDAALSRGGILGSIADMPKEMEQAQKAAQEWTAHYAAAGASTSSSAATASSSADDSQPSSSNSATKTSSSAPADTNSVDTSGDTYGDAMKTIQQNFDAVDTAAGIGTRDGVIAKCDLEAVMNNPDAPADLKKACEFLLKNPMYWNEAANGSGHGADKQFITKAGVDSEVGKVGNSSKSSSTGSTSGASGTDKAGKGQQAQGADSSSESDSSSSSSSASSASSSSDVSTGDPLEDKLTSMAENTEGQIQDLTKQMNNTSDPTQLQKIETQLQTLNQLMSLISNMQKEIHDMRMTIINNIR